MVFSIFVRPRFSGARTLHPYLTWKKIANTIVYAIFTIGVILVCNQISLGKSAPPDSNGISIVHWCIADIFMARYLQVNEKKCLVSRFIVLLIRNRMFLNKQKHTMCMTIIDVCWCRLLHQHAGTKFHDLNVEPLLTRVCWVEHVEV